MSGRTASDLFDQHYDRLYRLARRLTACEDDALDLVQETFLRAARAASVPADAPHAEAWLVRVLVNVRKDAWRKEARARRHGAALDCAPPADSGPEARAIARTMVWRALDRLSPRRRAVIVLHELEGMHAQAIAVLLGVSAITVRWHLSQGRRELARILVPPTRRHE